MASRSKVIEVSKLLLDQANARLGEEQPDQRTTEVALIQLLGDQLFEMAKDIVSQGMDPTTLMAVTPEGAPVGKYRVIEGNRRLLALRVLNDPSLIEGIVSSAMSKRISRISSEFRSNPIRSVQCVVFDEEEEARHWIELRHTGANNGAGLVEWDANEKDRYKSRHGGESSRSAAGQILDFVDRVYPPGPNDNKRIITTLQRIIGNPRVKERIGIEVSNGIVLSHFPGAEVIKGLSAIVGDLRSRVINVTDVYYEPDRVKYINGFSDDKLPDPSKRLSTPVALRKLSPTSSSSPEEVHAQSPSSSGSRDPANSPTERTGTNASTSSGDTSRASSGQKGNVAPASEGKLSGGIERNRRLRVRPLRPRATVIPSDCFLRITQPRVNAIYHELLKLEVDQFSNACAVLLRVFVELSLDSYIAAHSIMSENDSRSARLSKKLKEVAAHLRGAGRISMQLERAVEKISDGDGMFSASTVTFNQYVHNEFAYPHPSELRAAWDELQPFMSAIWSK